MHLCKLIAYMCQKFCSLSILCPLKQDNLLGSQTFKEVYTNTCVDIFTEKENAENMTAALYGKTIVMRSRKDRS